MKKIFTLMACAGLLSIGNAQAQQIKGDFNVQIPWESAITPDGGDEPLCGTVPDGWASSNVTQMGIKFPLIFEEADRTNPEGKGLKLENSYCGMMGLGSNAPAYITLGTLWVFADVWGLINALPDDADMAGVKQPYDSSVPVEEQKDCSDGGTVGGIAYTERPDSIVGYYKRTLFSATEGTTPAFGDPAPVGPENACILAYLWSGTFKSETKVDRVNNIYSMGGLFAPAGTPGKLLSEIQDDQDLCILGKKNAADGSTGKRIAKIEHKITDTFNDWKRISLPFEYDEADKTVLPEKMNIIISSANYFSRSDIRHGNDLYVDDVRLIYNSKLKSILINDAALEGFDEDVYEYTIPVGTTDIKAVAFGKNAEISYAPSNDKCTITVNDPTSASAKSYVYTINFTTPVGVGLDSMQRLQISVEDGKVVVEGNIDDEPVQVYTLQGTQVRNENLLPNTIYIVKAGSYTTRVLVK